MSERRACKAIGCCRMTVRYESTRSDDRDLRERMIFTPPCLREAVVTIFFLGRRTSRIYTHNFG